MKMLRPGDPCPCCGQPIKSEDPSVLLLLSWIQDRQRFPTLAEIVGIAAEALEKEGETNA